MREVINMNRKHLLLSVLSAGLILGAAFSAHAEGWVQSGNNWSYQYSDGSYARNEWMKGADGLWRWLDNTGNLAYNTWVDDTYYVGSDGIMVSGRWLLITDTDNETYWYYFNESGKRSEDKWQLIGGSHYHFDDEGHMETGWIEDGTYYCSESGAMKTGWAWLKDYEKYEDNSYPGDSDEDYHWYYFLASGKKYAPEDSTLGNGYSERRVEGIKYCFDEEGRMQTGWVDLGTSENGGITNYRYYNQDGSLRTGWYSLNPPLELENNYERSVEWFYFASDGTPRADTDGILTENDFVRINGKSYLFNENGTPVCGLQKVYEKANSDKYTSYFFGTYDQCNVQTGKINVAEGSGEVNQYYFDNHGAGYTGPHDSYLYYCGKLQVAEYGTRYQVISMLTESGSKYNNYLVSTSGKLSKNRTLKDADGVTYVTNASGVVIEKEGVKVDGEKIGIDPREPDYNF